MIGVWGNVVRIREDRNNIQILDVQLIDSSEVKAIHYIDAGHTCKIDAKVLVNISALVLNLGTGGYGFVIAVAQEDTINQKPTYPGHIMKLRYSPLQTPILAVESEESDYHSNFCHPFSLAGKKILLGELHSMLPILASLLHRWQEGRKIVYIMDDQASLYLSFSEHVRNLKKKIDLTTISFGQAIGGDFETINVYTALETAYKVLHADDIIITHGPGVVGTGSQRGFSGMQLVQWLHAVHTCGGEGIVIPRIQFGDKRQRHFGLSHHTVEAMLYHALIPAYLPFPVQEEAREVHAELNSATGYPNDSLDQVLANQFKLFNNKHNVRPIPIHLYKRQVEEALRWYGNPIKTMGRGFQEDPYFYYAVGAAFHQYRELLC